MANIRHLSLTVLLVICFSEIHGHGKMVDPLNRSSLGSSGKYPQVPVNYEDTQNYCGGFTVQYSASNGGKCGACGDNYSDPVPRHNENGGKYGMGIIVKKYKSGTKINITVDLTANHLGHFEFNVCELRNKTDVETEECFDKYPLDVVDKNGEIGRKYHMGNESRVYEIEAYLPKDLKSEHAVLRWHYRAGNNWGFCDEEKTIGRIGCGDQETFRSCADIAIV